MSGNTSLSYKDANDKVRKFKEDKKNFVVTFDPDKSESAKDILKSSLPKGGYEAKYVNEEIGFARVEVPPGQVDSTMSSFVSAPSSDVISGTLIAAVEDLPQGPGMTRYFLPNRLFIWLKEQYIDNASTVFANYGMKIEKDYGKGYFSVSLQAGASDLQSLFDAINANRENPEFNYVEVHEVGFDAALLAPNDGSYSLQWALKAAAGNQHINVENAWGLTTGFLSKVHIAVLDTGIDTNHPDINGGGTNKIQNQWPTGSFSVIEDNDPNGHGTKVGGIIGAITNNGPAGAVAGTAWNCGLYVVKIDHDLVTLDYPTVVQAIRAVKDTAISNNAANGKRYVMNLSWKCSNNSSVHIEITAAFNAGVVIVAAAGDGSPPVNIGNTPVYPASWTEVIAVAAHKNGANAPIRADSNFGSNVVIAPGDSNLTTFRGGGTGNSSGTSIAAGFVSGVAALCWSNNYKKNNNSFTATRQDVYNAILNNLTPWSGGVSIRGRLNAHAAVNAIR